MNYLVTGGAGFIGSNFLLHMVKKYPDRNFWNVDALTYAGNLKNLKDIEAFGNYRFVRADITDREVMSEVFDTGKFDVIVNFAAESHVDRSITDPGVFLNTNAVGTQVLLDLARDHKVDRFHQVSTDEVYGDLPLDKPEELFTEATPLNPSSPYSASKAAADMLVNAYARTYDLPVTISRCSNNYGPFQFPEKLIPLMISRANANNSVPVYGSGDNVRDWLHVLDHCEAIDIILQSGRPGEIYNIGGNTERANLDVVKTVLGILGKPESLITFVTDRAGHDKRYAIDATKMKEELGWSPRVEFTDGLRGTIDWYLNNEEWLQDIISGDYRTYFADSYGAI